MTSVRCFTHNTYSHAPLTGKGGVIPPCGAQAGGPVQPHPTLTLDTLLSNAVFSPDALNIEFTRFIRASNSLRFCALGRLKNRVDSLSAVSESTGLIERCAALSSSAPPETVLDDGGSAVLKSVCEARGVSDLRVGRMADDCRRDSEVRIKWTLRYPIMH